MTPEEISAAARGQTLDERLEKVWADAARKGTHLPGEPLLASALSSSRPALREALVRLEERGYIHRRKGADTTVNTSLLGIPARFDQRMETSALITAMGCLPRLDVLDVSQTRITIEEATEHDLPPSTEVYRVVKRWSADDVPVMLARDAVPMTKRVEPEAFDPQTTIVDLAETFMGERAGWEIVWPAAEVLDSPVAQLVDLPSGDPALALDISGVSPGGSVCYWTKELHLRGFFRYAMVRRADWR